MFKKKIAKISLIILLILVMVLSNSMSFIPNNIDNVYAAYESDWPELQQILAGIVGVYNTPPGVIDTVYFPDGPLLGNGDLGVVIGGDNSSQTFNIGDSDFWNSIGDSDFWNGNPSIGEMHRAFPIRFGGINVKMNNTGTSTSVDIQQEQDILNAEVRSVLNKNSKTINLRSWTADSEDLLVIELTTTSTEPVPMIVETWVPDVNFTHSAGLDGDKMWATRETYNGTGSLWVSRLAMSTRILGVTPTLSTDGSAKSTASFSVSASQPVKIVTSIKGGKNATTHLTDAKYRVGQITDTIIANLNLEHKEWWKQYWLKSYVQLNDDILNKYYYGSLYILGCASREGNNPPGLWGNWVTFSGMIDVGPEWYYPPECPAWDGDYHMNYNMESVYFGAYSSNRAELALPYYQPVLDYVPKAKILAQQKYGYSQGVLFPVGLGPWGAESSTKLWNQKWNALYTVLPFIWHYDYTQDTDFLQNTAYPFMKEVGDFWEADLVKDSRGTYNVWNSSPSEGGTNHNNLVDLTFIRTLFKSLLSASMDLNVDAGRRSKWKDILGNLAPLPTKIMSDSLKVGYEGTGDTFSDNWSGTYPVWPSDDIGQDSDPASFEVAYNSIESNFVRNLKSSWIRRRLTELFTATARIGYNPPLLYDNLKDVIEAEMDNNLFCNESDVGGLETVGGIEAVNEMLLQSHQNVLRFFPAWPSDKSAQFKRLRTKGAFLVSAQFTNGVTSNVQIFSEKGKSCTVYNPWPDKVLHVTDGNGVDVTVTADGVKYTFNTTAGMTYYLNAGTPTAIQSSFNIPELIDGLTPLNWNGSTWEETTEATWDYDYNSAEKKWANAKTADGSMFVWIPRYTYKINGTNNISIRFSNGKTDDISSGYLKHPAFTFGTDELEGIWVAKFEASDKGGADAGEIQVKPAVQSIRNVNVNGMFDKSRNFQTEQGLGFNCNSHLMKNSEWGAVAYMAQAIGSLPAKNTNANWYTGGSSSPATVWGSNVNQSTTGNAYGIYDMSGGTWDVVAGYVSSLVVSYDRSTLAYSEPRYRNVAESYSTDPALWTTRGMAIEETSTGTTGAMSWGGASSSYPTDMANAPLFRRGNAQNQVGGEGIFGFFPASGGAATDDTFRPVIVNLKSWNDPVLANGLTPVNWDGEIWENATVEAWDYDYSSDEKKWANAKTADGSMFVWVPRYTYKISGTNLSIRYSNGTIDDTSNGYLSLPSFTFGTDELRGIWVAKFEASDKGGADAGKIQVKPAVQSIRSVNSNGMFEKSRNFQTEQGLSIYSNSHLMKNSEWGAVAYLTQAMGSIPAKNTNADWYTGGSASEDSVWSGNVNQSTTGNVYGIYDMSGGTWDVVAGYVSSGVCTPDRTSVMNASACYKDVSGPSYQTDPALWTTRGMAIEETSTAATGATSWGGAASSYPNDMANAPLFRRGNAQNQVGGEGIFGFFPASGGAATDDTFRPVIVNLKPWNDPVLADGMTPINWNGSTWVDATTATWNYDYGSTEKKWANARTADGSMFVWIPRYTYKINGTNNISIKFSSGTSDDMSGGYLKQSAFTFGKYNEFKGIWVAKFEASDKGGADAGKIQVKPAVQSYRNINSENMYWGLDNFRIRQSLIANVHLIKNSEWGAVAYLTQAIGSLPAKNTNANWYTGGSDSEAVVWSSNVNQSTTGNVYGIYDMSGGAWDVVSSYISNAVVTSDRTSIMYAISGYKDIVGISYSTNQDLWTTKGMAIEETSTAGTGATSWGGATSTYPTDTANAPFFRRGNAQNQVSGEGIFGFFPASGGAASDDSFRPVIITK